MEFQCWNGENEAKSVTVYNQEGTFGVVKINLEVEHKSGVNLFRRQVDRIRYQIELLLSNKNLPLTEQDW